MKTKTMPSELSAADLIKYLNSRKCWHGKQYRSLCGEWLRKAEIRKQAPREATTYTTSYEPAPFGSDSPLEMVTLKSGEHEIAVIPVKLLREMIEELRPILNSENDQDQGHSPAK